MERDPEQLENLSLRAILQDSVVIPKSSPKTFSYITLSLVFPLSFVILAHSIFTHPFLEDIRRPTRDPARHRHDAAVLLLYQLLYFLILFSFSLLSTAAVVFTVASLYTSKPTSFTHTLSAIPRVFRRLFVTFLWISLLIVTYNLAFIGSLLFLGFVVFPEDSGHEGALIFSLIILLTLFIVAHVYITAIWHLASVISVLEPVYGFAALRKSRELLRGKTRDAAALVFGYLLLCAIISSVFSSVVVHGGGDYGIMAKVVVGGVCVGLLVVVNLVGLLVQSVFYYVCKSFHHQGIDKSALYDHLGGYLGEYVPLKSSIQMENL
ncbi:hypothetical protein ACLOJK_021833 [Asimina triloba]